MVDLSEIDKKAQAHQIVTNSVCIGQVMMPVPILSIYGSFITFRALRLKSNNSKKLFCCWNTVDFKNYFYAHF